MALSRVALISSYSRYQGEIQANSPRSSLGHSAAGYDHGRFQHLFGNLAGVPSDGIPYPIFTFCALLPWQLFTQALTHSSNSLVDNADVLTKVYFPRLILPFSAVIAGLVDFAIAFVVMAGMMVYYDIPPGWAGITLPLFILMAIVAALSVGLWLSALNVKYRDIRYTLPFLAQL